MHLIWRYGKQIAFFTSAPYSNNLDSSKSLSPIHLKNEDQGVGCQMTSLSNIKAYSHKFWPTWLGKHELNNDDMKEHATLDGEKLPSDQPYSQSQSNQGILGERKVPGEDHTN